MMNVNSQQVNITLVEEVEKHPVLYDYNRPGYSQKNETEKAWGEVARVVRMPVEDCKERWKNLKAVFVRNLKPPNSRKRPKKAYYLMDAMQFTVPYIRSLETLSENMKDPLKQEDHDEEEITEDFEEYTYEYETTEEPEIVPTPRRSPAPGTTKTKRLIENDTARVGHVPRKTTKPKPLDSEESNPQTEGLKMFLLSMLPDLLKMSDGQVRRFKRMALVAVDDVLSDRP
ncbi:transcription factor Adf-1-like [Toxorhynchites rutilus septentrionalis]|uniref:transcription factor Adf-1-like n=1 Tax=Toxorhynchites rutilus septentrionalis TaxID=329112 RepID=UPI00247966DA|nr:transcription factor Adf-1-like [Toxorhynchites rutilus septentrionalis]